MEELELSWVLGSECYLSSSRPIAPGRRGRRRWSVKRSSSTGGSRPVLSLSSSLSPGSKFPGLALAGWKLKCVLNVSDFLELAVSSLSPCSPNAAMGPHCLGTLRSWHLTGPPDSRRAAAASGCGPRGTVEIGNCASPVLEPCLPSSHGNV